MSDPETIGADTARSPSPASATSSEREALRYAFLVHSQKTLTQNLPPRVDDKLLARQKRRRTSKEDHAVLEEEYQRDPKPDKATRTSIVERVTLGEKEVQIWFQNRRQNDRRKSKPLQPHELVGPVSGLNDACPQGTNDDNLPADAMEQPDCHEHEAANECSELKSSCDRPIPSSFEPDALPIEQDESSERLLPSTQTSLATEFVGDSQPSAHEKVSRSDINQENSSKDESQSHSGKRKRAISDIRCNASDAQLLSRTGAEQDKKSPPSLRLSLSFDGEAMVRKQGELTPTPPKGKDALRISMSSDGKAVVRTENEPSPSKNRVSMFSNRNTRFARLQRSNSTTALGNRRSSAIFGRSRDPRNWESFVDTDARSALSTPAGSQTVSNVNSPKIFRSRSQRLSNQNYAGKHNALTPNADSSNDMSQQAREKRRKLSRTVSSLGRLESARGTKLSSNPLKESQVVSNAKKDLDDFEGYFGDSDKENWLPGTRTSQVRRRTVSHNSRRPVLGDSNTKDGRVNRNSNSISKNRRAREQSRKSGDKILPETSADVSAFMAGGNGPSQEEDLDCIQGLLSLSQGAWG